jgi:hypothetical protein
MYLPYTRYFVSVKERKFESSGSIDFFPKGPFSYTGHFFGTWALDKVFKSVELLKIGNFLFQIVHFGGSQVSSYI